MMIQTEKTILKSVQKNKDILEKTSRSFFSQYGTPKLLGASFFQSSQIPLDIDPDLIFDQLMSQCGYSEPGEFFQSIFEQIQQRPQRAVRFKAIELPALYLYTLLESLFPGQSVHSITRTDHLYQTCGQVFEEPDGLQPVLDQFPVKLSDHVIRQTLVSKAVFDQYMPKINELDSKGHDITFDGHFQKGLLEQMYQNRVVFLLDMKCPVYCRFCFRKHKSNRKEKTPSVRDVEKAVDHVRTHPLVKEILITGGEPLLNRKNLDTAIHGLIKIDHVQTIRIATRSIAYYPYLFLDKDKRLIKDLIALHKKAGNCGKAIEIGIHLVHPDEISVSSLEILSELIRNGIRIYLQTPFLNQINTDGKILAELFNRLRQMGVQIYYIFTPCSPIYGTKDFWTSISKAFDAEEYLHDHVSDRAIPKLCTATPLGKIEWQTSGWAVEKDSKDSSFTWIRTPYTQAYFEQFLTQTEDIKDQVPDFRVNSEGTLDARFRLDMGRSALHFGARPQNHTDDQEHPSVRTDKLFSKARGRIEETDLFRNTRNPMPSKEISLFNNASVEISQNASTNEFEYIQHNPEITEVVVHGSLASESEILDLEQRVMTLKRYPQITCARVCLKSFLFHPEGVSDIGIEKMMSWPDFSVANPFRIEIETWGLTPGLDTKIGNRVRKLLEKGINTYANVPVISGLNDHPGVMVELARDLRKHYIEFHHLYVYGLALQHQLESELSLFPITEQEMIDIASEVRIHCSGREIPKYRYQDEKGDHPYRLWGMDKEIA